MSAQGKAGVALVNAHAADGSANLTQLREMLLCLHVQRLLHANGYDVHMCGDTVIPQLHSMFGSSPQGSDNSAVEVKQDSREKLLNVAVEASPFKLKNEPQHSTESTDTLQPLALSAQEFIKQEGLLTGGQHYSKNLDILTVKQGQTWTPAFHEVIRLDSQQNLLNNKDVAVVVHVASAEKQYYQQQVDILWRMLCEISVPQVHLTHASVTCQKGRGLAKSTTASDLIKLRTEQMKEAYVVKYGDVVKGAEWDDTIQVAASAIVKFEMLSTSSNTSVKLDLLQTGGLIGSKGGAFVLYNYARLSTLFQHHEEDVEAGYYPALPDFEDVDTSLLVEEEEWSLLFNYILPFPTLVKDCVGEFHANSPHANIYTHKICIIPSKHLEN
ncbi:PREDICTED: DALR anticodon-binding domain-containing protein 3-like isoform X2 [Priapulus caudatus]|nr:PREDICTED: DALR anticodon-binding domain-containing protein 3-like isoform X2 [Priapulus caudatus]